MFVVVIQNLYLYFTDLIFYRFMHYIQTQRLHVLYLLIKSSEKEKKKYDFCMSSGETTSFSLQYNTKRMNYLFYVFKEYLCK